MWFLVVLLLRIVGFLCCFGILCDLCRILAVCVYLVCLFVGMFWFVVLLLLIVLFYCVLLLVVWFSFRFDLFGFVLIVWVLCYGRLFVWTLLELFYNLDSGVLDVWLLIYYIVIYNCWLYCWIDYVGFLFCACNCLWVGVMCALLFAFVLTFSLCAWGDDC